MSITMAEDTARMGQTVLVGGDGTNPIGSPDPACHAAGHRSAEMLMTGSTMIDISRLDRCAVPADTFTQATSTQATSTSPPE